MNTDTIRSAIALAAPAIRAALAGRTDADAQAALADIASIEADPSAWTTEDAAWAIEKAAEAGEPCEGDAHTPEWEAALDAAQKAGEMLFR